MTRIIILGAGAMGLAATQRAVTLGAEVELIEADREPGGMAAIITFHSGEDRIVKHHFRDLQRKGLYSEDGRDPIIGTEEECRKNPRARSAKLRWAKRSAMPVTG